MRSRLAGECARIAQRGDAGVGVRAGARKSRSRICRKSFTRRSFSAGLHQFAALPDMEQRAILAALEEKQGPSAKGRGQAGYFQANATT